MPVCSKTISQKRNAQAIVDVPKFMDKLGSAAVIGARTPEGACDDAATLNALASVFPALSGNKIKNKFTNGAPIKAIATEPEKGTFQVAHYAGTVTYHMAGFCGKSIDTLDASTRAMIDNATGPTITFVKVRCDRTYVLVRVRVGERAHPC